MSQSFSERVSIHRYRRAVITMLPEGENKRAALAAAGVALQGELAFERPARMGGRSVGRLGRTL